MALVYDAAAQAGLRFAAAHESITLIWPPAGIALAVLLLLGMRYFPGVLVGSYLVNLGVGSIGPWFGLLVAFGNCAEALTAYVILRRVGFDAGFGRVRDALVFVGLAVWVAPLVAATVGVSAVVLSGSAVWGSFPVLFVHWWLGDAMAILLVTPFLTTTLRPGGLEILRNRFGTALALLLVILLLLHLVYRVSWVGQSAESLVFFFFPLVLLAGAILGPTGASVLTLVIAVGSILGTYQGSGPFRDDSLSMSLFQLHGFLGSIATAGLVPAALMWEREHSEKELRSSERRFREVVSGMLEGVVLIDALGKILTVNPSAARILGYSAQDMEGKSSLDPVWRVVHEDGSHFPAAEYPHMVALSSGQACRDVVLGVHKPDNSLAWLVANAQPLFREGEIKPYAAVVTFHDITERKLSEESRARAQRMESLGTLAGGLAHDLNNVLAPVRLGLDYLVHKVSDPAGRSMMEMMEAGIDRGVSLIGQILTYVRGNSGGARRSLEARDLVSEMEGWVKRTFPANIALRVAVAPDVPVFQGDPVQLHQALLNLIVNARDAMPSGGELTIAASARTLQSDAADIHRDARAGDYVEFTVCDTGSGIPASLKQRILEPFFTTKSAGTGLGLAIVDSVAVAHGGFVQIQSRPGQTEISVWLPTAGRAAPGGQPKVPAGGDPGAGELVLLVEDEEQLRTTTAQLLRESGYSVHAVANGREAGDWFAINRAQVDVLVTDISLPGESGADLLVRLRQSKPDLPVVAISGLPAGPELKGELFLQKPFSLPRLLAAIKEALGRRRGPV